MGWLYAGTIAYEALWTILLSYVQYNCGSSK